MTDAERLIARTLARYCQTCDDGDFDAFAGCFTTDAVFAVMGNEHRGRDAIKTFMAEAMPPERRGKHLLGQSLVDVGDGGSDATAVTDFVFVAKAGERSYAITSAGRYHDALRREDDGEWRLAARELRFL